MTVPKPQGISIGPSEVPPPVKVTAGPPVKVVEGPALELKEPELDSTGPWVKYIGPATLRIMDGNAWRSAGVKSDKYIEWNYLNNMSVPVKFFTEAELGYLLHRDGRFIKVN
jgi:hypothetical protein